MNPAWNPVSEHDENMSLRNNIEKRAQESTETPNNGDSEGSSQRAERNNEALVTSIRSFERDANTVIITAGAICASILWCILRGIEDMQAARTRQKIKRYHNLYTAFLSHVPQTNSLTSPQVPPIPYGLDPALASPGLDLLWANVYWTTSLVFGLSAIFIAILIKNKIGGYKVVFQRRGRPPLEQAQIQVSLDRDVRACYMLTDTMYRLLQVCFVVLPLGHASYLYPLGGTIFVPTVVGGLLYAFGAIGPFVRLGQPPWSPSSG
ncbi:hypothetical protein EDB86DRAFT_3085539 [Lactarius hatsudake]|nr:hypothetical protein EDB86DRAFT_3085539 [Lactarius hatsudake]